MQCGPWWPLLPPLSAFLPLSRSPAPLGMAQGLRAPRGEFQERSRRWLQQLEYRLIGNGWQVPTGGRAHRGRPPSVPGAFVQCTQGQTEVCTDPIGW